MKILKEIKDKEFPSDESTLRHREASRAVLFDENGQIPLMFVSRHNYYKLPGGGIDEGESREQALIREIKEEVGSEIEITGEIGQIIEHRSEYNLKQISYCYIGKIISKGTPSFTGKELSMGLEVVWLSLDEAIVRVKNQKFEDYEGSFIQKRDSVLLKQAGRMSHG